MSADTVILQMAHLEIAHLRDLVSQFADLLDASDATSSITDDPGIRRLVPDAYDEAEAAGEFRALTENDLLSRRATDAAMVLASLDGAVGAEDDPAESDEIILVLDADTAQAWLRSIAAIRLVLATRLGIDDEDDHDEEDPRFGIYDWLGFRLDGLVRAIDAA